VVELVVTLPPTDADVEIVAFPLIDSVVDEPIETFEIGADEVTLTDPLIVELDDIVTGAPVVELTSMAVNVELEVPLLVPFVDIEAFEIDANVVEAADPLLDSLAIDEATVVELTNPDVALIVVAADKVELPDSIDEAEVILSGEIDE
jgi:hypothetical protein